MNLDQPINYKSLIKKLFYWLIGILALAFSLGAVIRCWSDFSHYRNPISNSRLILGIGCTLGSYLIQSIGWYILMKSIAGPVRFLTAMRSWSYSQVAKYIPGKVMVYVIRVQLCQEDKILPSKVLTATSLEIILCLVSSMSIWLISSFLYPTSPEMSRFWYFVLLLGLISCLHPKITTLLMRHYYRLRGTLDTTVIPNLTWYSVLKPAVFYLAGWLLYGLGGYFIATALINGQKEWIPPVSATIGAFTFAWAVGYIVILTPGGLGVREGSLVLALSPWMPVSLAVIVAGLARLCQSGVDLGFAAGWYLTYKLKCMRLVSTNRLPGEKNETHHSDTLL